MTRVLFWAWWRINRIAIPVVNRHDSMCVLQGAVMLLVIVWLKVLWTMLRPLDIKKWY